MFIDSVTNYRQYRQHRSTRSCKQHLQRQHSKEENDTRLHPEGERVMVKYLKTGGRDQIQNSNKGSFVKNVQKLFNSFPVTLDSNHIYASQVTPSGQDDRTLRTLKSHFIQNQCNKHLQSTYYLPGTVLGTGHRHELNMVPVLKGLTA